MEAKELKCGELRLNLGCGDDEMIGFIGIDKMEKSKANEYFFSGRYGFNAWEKIKVINKNNGLIIFETKPKK
jgi:hypothetical protein